MIQELINEYDRTTRRLSELEHELSEYYNPVISQMVTDRDMKGLERLLIEMPISMAKMVVYQAIRELKEQNEK